MAGTEAIITGGITAEVIITDGGGGGIADGGIRPFVIVSSFPIAEKAP
jgi:hypothetical protein